MVECSHIKTLLEKEISLELSLDMVSVAQFLLSIERVFQTRRAAAGIARSPYLWHFVLCALSKSLSVEDRRVRGVLCTTSNSLNM